MQRLKTSIRNIGLLPKLVWGSVTASLFLCQVSPDPTNSLPHSQNRFPSPSKSRDIHTTASQHNEAGSGRLAPWFWNVSLCSKSDYLNCCQNITLILCSAQYGNYQAGRDTASAWHCQCPFTGTPGLLQILLCVRVKSLWGGGSLAPELSFSSLRSAVSENVNMHSLIGAPCNKRLHCQIGLRATEYQMSLLEILDANYHSKVSEKPHSKKKKILSLSIFHVDPRTPFTSIPWENNCRGRGTDIPTKMLIIGDGCECTLLHSWSV